MAEPLSEDDRSRLVEAAQMAAGNAYAPYSGFMVGASVLTNAGNVYPGCNVENVSYGLTICAERAAIFAAVTAEGGEDVSIRALAVFTAHGAPGSPCGACRQVIAEFGSDSLVIFQGVDGVEEIPASDLLPKGFTIE